MIRRITSILNDAVTAMPVGVRVPFAEVIDGVPSRHAGGGQFVPVINDAAGGVSYWRANGAQQVTQLDATAACGDAVRVSVPIALVAFVRREQCDAPDELLNSAAHQVRSSLRAVRDSMQGAFGVNVSGLSMGVDIARTNEVRDFVVPSSLVVLTLSMVIHVDISANCIEQCGEPYDLTCAVIDRASNVKVVACLGPERVAEICDAPVCDPMTVTLGGVEIVDEADPCGAAVVLECTDLVDAVVVEGAGTEAANGLYVRDGVRNGQPSYLSSANYKIHYEDFDVDEFYWSVEDDQTDTLYRTDTPGDQLFGRTWVTTNGSDPAPTVRQATIADICGGGGPCDDGSAVLKDTAGDTLSTTAVPAGTTVDITAPDATVKTTDGVTTVQVIVSGGIGNLPQSVIKYTDAANAAQVTAAADTEFATTLRPATVVPRRQILNSAGNAANATYADLDDLISNTMPVAGDATAVVKNLNGTTLVSEAIPANASENITAPIPLKFALAAGDDTSITWTVTDDEAGTYGTYTQDGASGTLTYSLNGGAYAALSGAIVLAVSDTIAVKRTTYSAAGWIKWAP